MATRHAELFFPIHLRHALEVGRVERVPNVWHVGGACHHHSFRPLVAEGFEVKGGLRPGKGLGKFLDVRTERVAVDIEQFVEFDNRN